MLSQVRTNGTRANAVRNRPAERWICPLVQVATLCWFLMQGPSAQAQAFSVIENFNGSLGQNPTGPLVADQSGNLYGSDQTGGTFGYGSLYELPVGGGEKSLYSFTGGSLGANPYFTALTRGTDGNFYGVTPYGGNLSNDCVSLGCGVVFRVTQSGKEKVLYSFQGGSDGSFPFSQLIAGENGKFYGVAGNGGGSSSSCEFGCGVVYELNAAGKETVLYSFTGGSDGADPGPGLIRDSQGNLYGTTGGGGVYGGGTVFMLDPAGDETTLYSFTGGADGFSPLFLIRDAEGNLYGNTAGGGDLSCTLGCGVLFEIDSSGDESTIYTFTNGAGGYYPLGPMVRDPDGNLYGTANQGGSTSNECPAGCGVVFRVGPSGAETVLHGFVGTDGAYPFGGLLRFNNYLYGTTTSGGTGSSGTAYKITP